MQLFQINQSEESSKITINAHTPSCPLHELPITWAAHYRWITLYYDVEDKERHCGVICHCRYRTRDVQWRILAFNQKFDASERKINSCCRTQYKTQCKMHFTLFFTIDNNLPSRRQWGCLCITEKDLKDRKVVVNKKFYLKTTLKAWHFLTNLYSLWLCAFYANLINWHHG